MQNDQKPIVGAILIVGVMIAGAILLKGSKPQTVTEPINNNTANLMEMQGRPVSLNDHIIGNQNAEIVIVEYSDLECPFCKVFHNTIHQVVANNNGNVAWVYRHYPIQERHPKAFHEAEATECASEQGGNDAFWKYTDRLFEISPTNNGLDVVELPKIAQYIGLNVENFTICLDSGKYKDKIQADIDDGVKTGVNGTPHSIVVTKKEITTKKQAEIIAVVPKPDYSRGERDTVTFDSKSKNKMSMNGALPPEMINKILAILLK